VGEEWRYGGILFRRNRGQLKEEFQEKFMELLWIYGAFIGFETELSSSKFTSFSNAFKEATKVFGDL
jgi:hypothetical protein